MAFYQIVYYEIKVCNIILFVKLFNGKFEAENLDRKIKSYLELCSYKTGNLLIIKVGDDPASQKYVKLKINLCLDLGIEAEAVNIPSGLADIEIESEIKTLLDNKKVSGCIIQLPLPRDSLHHVLDLIPLSKDIDLLSSASRIQYYSPQPNRYPPVVRAFEYFLVTNGIRMKGKNAMVIGGGELVGRSITHYLLSQGATVTLKDETKPFDEDYYLAGSLAQEGPYEWGSAINSDLVVLSVGNPGLVRGEDICENCHLVDFGSSVVGNKTVGDFDINSSKNHLGVVSPSPGGMGPLVMRYLLMNHFGI